MTADPWYHQLAKRVALRLKYPGWQKLRHRPPEKYEGYAMQMFIKWVEAEIRKVWPDAEKEAVCYILVDTVNPDVLWVTSPRIRVMPWLHKHD